MSSIYNLEQIVTFGLQGIFYLTMIVFVGFSLSIIYHWFAYGIHKSKVLILLAVYLGISSILILGMSLSLNAL